MKRGMIYKLIFILALIGFSVALILPTVGTKYVDIILHEDISREDIDLIKNRFPAQEYDLTTEGNVITISSVRLTEAVMNEIRSFDGVLDAYFHPHWAEEKIMARRMNLGLDLQGGMHLVLRADFDAIERRLEEKLSDAEKHEITRQALEILRDRVDRYGVSEPSIRPRGYEAIEIQLPGVTDPEAVKEAIGTTGRVEYRLVDDNYSELVLKWMENNHADKPLPVDRDAQYELLNKMARDIDLPGHLEVLFYCVPDEETDIIVPVYPIVVNRDAALAGEDVARAWVGTDEYGGLAVHFQTTREGALKFARVTDKPNQGKRLSVLIDNNVRSAPTINHQITGGQAVISGHFTVDEVRTLARIIQEGALPVDLNFMEERTVGPTLGQDSIEAGVKAIFIGLSGIILFMLLIYKAAGVIACVGLTLNMIFLLALLSWMGFTLTLPGIAGLILTVGLAVDGNVIIYERIKEEIRLGKSVRMAIIYGYDKGFSTIIDANLTTLIAAFVLSQFGTGPIQGFAVTLFVGILTSMFTVLYVTRFVYELISLNKRIKKLYI